MKRWKGVALVSIAALLVFGLGYLILSFVFLDFVVDLMWFRSLGYGLYFWLRILYRYAILSAAIMLFCALFFGNFWLASRYLGTRRPSAGQRSGTAARAYRELLALFRSSSLKIYGPLSLVLAVVLALPLFREWESTLLYLFGSQAGTTDPLYGKDISYYMFAYPIYSLLQARLFFVSLVLLGATFVLYWLERRVLSQEQKSLPVGAKMHLTVLIFFATAVATWGYLLARHGLVYSQNQEPLFVGPGFTEMRVVAPLIWSAMVLLPATAVAAVLYLYTRRGKVFAALIVLLAAFFAAHALRHSDFLIRSVERYLVKPNQISREQPYIEASVLSTLRAYGLDKVETRDYPIQRIPSAETIAGVRENLRNIPVWDSELLGDVYEQLQGIRPYYDFQGIDVDRYTVRGLYQQVYLAARELNLEKLPKHARNWMNDHLLYTHGYGVVMTPAAQGGDEFMTWFIKDIPPRSDFGLEVEQPHIYYGLGDSTYVVAPNDLGEMDYPKGDANVKVDYSGKGGVALPSLFRRALFAAYFKDYNLVLTTKTNNRSRIQFRRNVVDRIGRLTPFLRLDADPYLVVTAKGTFWIQDAYTVSSCYPNAGRHPDGFNYIRNSVKIVVDAYHGSVTCYLSDPEDPIVRAYSAAYPGLMKPLNEMDGELRAHVRYPRDLFEIQMSVYAKYHQRDPEVFYRGEDIWEFARLYREQDTLEIKPYYLTLDLLEPDKKEFLLLCPMIPRGRDNLRALAVVGCDGDHYGRLIVYSFPKGTQVYGPSQINALIDQDTLIAQQFTLWNQAGSEVMRGKMIILPVGNIVYYIQPVYLRAAARLKIPELKRLIVGQDDTVVMDKNLEEAFTRLQQSVRDKTEQQRLRFQQADVGTGAPSRPGTTTPKAP